MTGSVDPPIQCCSEKQNELSFVSRPLTDRSFVKEYLSYLDNVSIRSGVSVFMKLPVVILVAATATAINSSLATAGELQANPTINGDLDRSPSSINQSIIARTPTDTSQQKKRNYVSLTKNFGKIVKSPTALINDQSLDEAGITGRIGISDSISIRPFIAVGTGNVSGINFENATFGASVTYDLNIPNYDFTPYGGIGYATSTLKVPTLTSLDRSTSSGYIEVGADYQLPDSNIVLNANYKIQDGGTFGISAGWGF